MRAGWVHIANDMRNDMRISAEFEGYVKWGGSGGVGHSVCIEVVDAGRGRVSLSEH